jgi:hypothetical protein
MGQERTTSNRFVEPLQEIGTVHLGHLRTVVNSKFGSPPGGGSAGQQLG